MDPNQTPQPQPQTPAAPNNNPLSSTPPFEPKTKSTALNSIIIGLIVLMLLVGAGAAFFFVKGNASTSKPTDTSEGIPTPKTTDLAPGVPEDQKASVVIEHSDSTLEKFIMTKDKVQEYTKSLPPGDRVITQ